MRKIILSLACISALCFGEDDPKCRELFEESPKFVIEALKNPPIIETSAGEKCFCTETITCGKEEYCIFVKCPSLEQISVFKEPPIIWFSDTSNIILVDP
jgi:hypothetical protein